MSSTSRGAGSPVQRPAPHKWYFTKEELRNTASIREGMSREEEMSHRQMAAAFIQEMIDGLNIIKDPRQRIGHTGLCVAHTYMHRFYYFHSFKKFDYRDVGAACVFLAGKSQECPRKLSHVIDIWREKRDRKPPLTSQTARTEACQIIVLLESMILQTISFDLNIILPHTKVLEIMGTVDPRNIYKKMCNCAYYFATDVIAVTDWCLRYDAATMAIAIIHLMAAYGSVKIEELFVDYYVIRKKKDKDKHKDDIKNDEKKEEIGVPCPWWGNFDDTKTMTEEKLKEMELDFLNSYRSSCKFHYASKLIPDFANNAPRPLENPDVANRRVDRGRSNSPLVTNNHHHMTESNGRPRGYVPKDELTVERLNKERMHEEERRKRDHDRMSGRIDNSTSSEKRARIDPLYSNFVSSSSSSTSNGRTNSSHNPQVPVPQITSSTSSGASRNSMKRPVDKYNNSSPTSSSPVFKASARAFDVAPMLTPPVAPKMQSGDHNSDMDLEDGELE